MKTPTIAILYAMDKERATFLDILTAIETFSIMQTTFVVGRYEIYRVILAKCGIGKVNAAIVTTLLIEHFEPDLIINSGIAGGYLDTLQPLDMVIANQVIYADVDMTTDASTDLAYGQLQDFPLAFTPNVEMFAFLSETQKDTLHLHFGTLLSGDQFVTNYDQVSRMVQSHFAHQDILAFDMESGAIAQVCYLYHTKFLIIRAISDVIGSKEPFQYQTFSMQAAGVACELTKEIIKQM